MNQRLTVLLAAVCVGCIAFAVLQQKRIVTLTQERVQLRAQAETLQTTGEDDRSQAVALRKQVQILKDRVAATATALEQERQRRIEAETDAAALSEAAMDTAADTATAKKERPGFMKQLGDMMNDPDMRDAMRAQQRMVLELLYGPLFEKLGLGPEEAGLLKDLLVDRQMAGVRMLGSGDRKTLAATLADAHKQTDEAIRSLLGDEKYPAYEDYQATIGERMLIKQLNDQLAAKSIAMDEAQREELITLMVEERVAARIPSSEQQQLEWAGDMPSADKVEELLAKSEVVNLNIHERSEEILSEAQREALQAFLANQVKMQRMGMQMMKSMMGEEEE